MSSWDPLLADKTTENMQISKMSCGLWWCKAITKTVIHSPIPVTSAKQSQQKPLQWCTRLPCLKGLLNSWMLWQGLPYLLQCVSGPWFFFCGDGSKANIYLKIIVEKLDFPVCCSPAISPQCSCRASKCLDKVQIGHQCSCCGRRAAAALLLFTVTSDMRFWSNTSSICTVEEDDGSFFRATQTTQSRNGKISQYCKLFLELKRFKQNSSVFNLYVFLLHLFELFVKNTSCLTLNNNAFNCIQRKYVLTCVWTSMLADQLPRQNLWNGTMEAGFGSRWCAEGSRHSPQRE